MNKHKRSYKFSYARTFPIPSQKTNIPHMMFCPTTEVRISHRRPLFRNAMFRQKYGTYSGWVMFRRIAAMVLIGKDRARFRVLQWMKFAFYEQDDTTMQAMVQQWKYRSRWCMTAHC